MPACPASDTLAGFAVPTARLQTIPQFEEFQTVMRQGLRFGSPHFMLHCCPSQHDKAAAGGYNRIGALLPKRWAKKAVRRNALRRKIYALARQSLPLLAKSAGQPIDCVLRLRAAWLPADFPSAKSPALQSQLDTELRALFALAESKIRPFKPTVASTQP